MNQKRMNLTALPAGKESVVKSWLRQAEGIMAEINSLRLQLIQVTDQSFALASPSSFTNSRVQSSLADQAAFAASIVEKDSLEAKIRDRLNELTARKDQIIRVINQYTTGTENLVLTARYVCGQKWPEIASELGYSIRQLSRIEKSGMEKIILPDHLSIPA